MLTQGESRPELIGKELNYEEPGSTFRFIRESMKIIFKICKQVCIFNSLLIISDFVDQPSMVKLKAFLGITALLNDV